MKRLWCRLFGHGKTKDWYEPWRRSPVTNRWLDRDVVTVCNRCGATLATRTIKPGVAS